MTLISVLPTVAPTRDGFCGLRYDERRRQLNRRFLLDVHGAGHDNPVCRRWHVRVWQRVHWRRHRWDWWAQWRSSRTHWEWLLHLGRWGCTGSRGAVRVRRCTVTVAVAEDPSGRRRSTSRGERCDWGLHCHNLGGGPRGSDDMFDVEHCVGCRHVGGCLRGPGSGRSSGAGPRRAGRTGPPDKGGCRPQVHDLPDLASHRTVVRPAFGDARRSGVVEVDLARRRELRQLEVTSYMWRRAAATACDCGLPPQTYTSPVTRASRPPGPVMAHSPCSASVTTAASLGDSG